MSFGKPPIYNKNKAEARLRRLSHSFQIPGSGTGNLTTELPGDTQVRYEVSPDPAADTDRGAICIYVKSRSNSNICQVELGIRNNTGYIEIQDSTGTNQFRVDENTLFMDGDVGIGTPTPSKAFEIFDNSSSTDFGMLIRQNGSGDCLQTWAINNTTVFSLGIDNSDSDKLKLSASDALDVNTILTIDTAGMLGIGTTSPDAQVNIESDQKNAEVRLTSFKNTASAAFYRMRKARGTQASPTTVANGDLIGGFIGGAFDGSIYAGVAQVDFEVAGPKGSSQFPGRVNFKVSDGTASPARKFVVESNLVDFKTALRANSTIQFSAMSAGVLHANATGVITSSVVDISDDTNLAAGTGLALVNDTMSLSHLGIEDLVDPNADRILFWDDSGTKADWLTPGNGLTITNTTISVAEENLDHGSLSGLSDDDHTQYALLAGRSGGQILIGGTVSGDDLTLQSTSNATRGSIFFGSAATSAYDEVNDQFGIGTTSPDGVITARNDVAGSPARLTVRNDGAVQIGTAARISMYAGAERAFLEYNQDGTGEFEINNVGTGNMMLKPGNNLVVEGANLLLGTKTSPTANATKIMAFGDNVNKPTMGANTAGIYGKSDANSVVQVYVISEDGVESQISPHYNFEKAVAAGIAPDDNDPIPRIEYSENSFIGVKQYVYENPTTGERSIVNEWMPDTSLKSWDVHQEEQYQKRLAEQDAWNTLDSELQAAYDAAMIEWEKNDKEGDEPVRGSAGPYPPDYVKKPTPAIIKRGLSIRDRLKAEGKI